MIRTQYSVVAMAAIALALTGCGQSKSDFSQNAHIALASACTSEAIPGMKAHVLASWKWADIDEASQRTSAMATEYFDKLSWDLGISRDQMRDMMSEARTHGQTLVASVSVTSYPDGFGDALVQVSKPCEDYAGEVVEQFQSRLKD
jgi:hypothetical protein